MGHWSNLDIYIGSFMTILSDQSGEQSHEKQTKMANTSQPTDAERVHVIWAVIHVISSSSNLATQGSK
jgi:hypothetical protein